jgi:hypothetical protein
MSQRRFVVVLMPDYDRALAAKKIFEKENPEITYQIRRKRGGSFAVVKRLQSDEPNPTTRSKKRRNRYRYFAEEESNEN